MEQAQTPPTPQPTEQPPQPSSIPPPSSTISSSPNPNPTPTPTPNPNQNPNPKPLTSLQSHHQQQQQQAHQQHQSLHTSQTRPPFNRTWQQQSSHFSHFSSHPHSLPSSSSSLPSTSGSSAPSLSSSASSSVSVPLGQRGGIAIGVPAAHHPSPTPPQSAPFSPSFAQQFGGLGRNAVTMPDSVANSNTSQMRQPTQGYQSMGVMGSLGSGSQMRAGGVPAHHQQRPVQQSLRPQSTPINQSTGTQNFQGHSLLRVPSAGSPGSPSPNTSQSMQSHNQPWLSSGSQGKPPLPSPSFRPPMNPQSLQQRSHIPQQHQHPLPTASQQQQMSSAQQPQQPLPSHQQQEHYGQQFPPLRVPQSLSHQQQITRVQGSGNQKPSSPAMAPPSAVQSGPQNRTASLDTGESGNRILSKRSIHELVNQDDVTPALSTRRRLALKEEPENELPIVFGHGKGKGEGKNIPEGLILPADGREVGENTEVPPFCKVEGSFEGLPTGDVETEGSEEVDPTAEEEVAVESHEEQEGIKGSFPSRAIDLDCTNGEGGDATDPPLVEETPHDAMEVDPATRSALEVLEKEGQVEEPTKVDPPLKAAADGDETLVDPRVDDVPPSPSAAVERAAPKGFHVRPLVGMPGQRGVSTPMVEDKESGVVEVHGFPISVEFAPIVERIFSKHGDIARGCIVTNETVRSTLIEVLVQMVCLVTTNSPSTMLEDDLNFINTGMVDLETMGFDLAWFRPCITYVTPLINYARAYNLLDTARRGLKDAEAQVGLFQQDVKRWESVVKAEGKKAQDRNLNPYSIIATDLI